MKKILLKRGFILIVILLFLGISIYPNQVSSTTLINQNVKPGEIFFGLKSHIDITWDKDESLEPIMPLSEIRILTLNVSYWVTWGILGRITNHFLSKGGVNIDIDIIDKPEYCEAYLEYKHLHIPIPSKHNKKESSHTNIQVSLDEKAPAFERCNITIQATMDHEIKGPLGFITLLSPAKITVNLTVVPDYFGLISCELPEGNFIETPPLIEKQLPIILYNKGNGYSRIKSEILEYPSDFIIYIDPENLYLDVGENKTTYLKVLAPSNFSGRETIQTKFTPNYVGRPELKGPSEIITFYFYYDVS